MTTTGVIPSWQDISWHGISFQVPATWQPVVILNNYLLFEDQYQPILELKWQQIKGSFSVERILKQLRNSGSKKDVWHDMKLIAKELGLKIPRKT